MRILLFVLCSFPLLLLVKSQSCQASIGKVEIICSSIENTHWWSIGFQLTCRGDESITSSFPDSSVSSIVHSNKSEVTNLAEITGLIIRNATVKFIPNGITKQFINLKSLLIYSCGLLSINKEDLRQFGSSLESLELEYNKLTSINADLLEYNANLKAIYLNENQIRHIEPEFFTSLIKLSDILFSAGCISQKISIPSVHNIATFKWNNERCFNETARIETQLAPINARVQQSLNNELCLKEQIIKMSKNFKCQMNSIEAKLEILIQNNMNPSNP